MKKIILVIFSFFLISGVVSASSINGEYNGNPIVKVYVNGSEIRPEVPAHIVDGTTMLPMRAVAEALGADVEWDQSTYAAQIIKLERDDISTAKATISSAKEVLAESGIKVTNLIFAIDDKGPYVSLNYDMESKTTQQSLSDLTTIPIMFLGVRHLTDDLLISIYSGSTYGGIVAISLSDTQDYLDRKITLQEYTSRWIVRSNIPSGNNTPNSNLIPAPPSSQTSTIICNQINQKYDQLKRLTQEELGERGLGRSSRYDSEMAKIEQDRQAELEANGCPAP